MRILDERLENYLHALRPARSEVMAEMEEVARRDSVPIVHWETGRFLGTLCRALDPNVLEVGTAIGYSTLHLAEALSAGRVTTLAPMVSRASPSTSSMRSATPARLQKSRACRARSGSILVGGEVALPEGAEGRGSAEAVTSARALNPDLLDSRRWLGSVLPIGDGVGFAARL